MSYSDHGPSYPYGYGAPSGPVEPPASRTNAISSLIANLVGLVLCCLLTLPGLVLSIIAMVTTQSSPQASRVCAIIAWVLFGLGVVVGAFLWVVFGLPAMYTLAIFSAASSY